MRWEDLPLKPTCCCMRKQSCHLDAELKIWSEQDLNFFPMGRDGHLLLAKECPLQQACKSTHQARTSSTAQRSL